MKLLILVLLVATQVFGDNNESLSDEFSSFVSLEYRGVHRCGATIVAPYFLVTSARCTLGKTEQFKVRAANSTYRLVKNIVRHKNFTNFPLDLPTSDIAIIHLKDRLIFNNNIKKADLVGPGIIPNGNSLVTVIGYDSEGKVTWRQRTADDIREASDNFCDLHEENNNKRVCKEYIIWPNPKDDTDSGVPGDSMYNHDGQLIGILSYSRTLGKLFYPEIYTNLSHFRKWLDDNIDY